VIRRNRTLGYGIAAAVFILDQLIKWLVTGPLGVSAPGDVREVLPFFNLSFVANNGISLGLFPAGSDGMRWLLVAVTLLISIGVAVWLWRERSRGDAVALGIVLGGAIGNIVDRTRVGYVIDYADLHFGSWQPFLVFNLADAAITVGAVILVLRAFFVKRPDDQPESHHA
jgi:signal peptidase II